MNMLLLNPEECLSPTLARIEGARLKYVLERHQLNIEAKLKIGVLNGNRGSGKVRKLSNDSLELEIDLDETLPQAYSIKLIVGICRPQTVKKLLQLSASSGIESIYFVRSENAEKSYFQSPVLQADSIKQEIWEGLEQGMNTYPPKVKIFERFLGLIDLLGSPKQECELRLLADTKVRDSLQSVKSYKNITEIYLAVGPESGWSQFEREQLLKLDFSPFSLGRFSLRVEYAAAAALGLLIPLLEKKK